MRDPYVRFNDIKFDTKRQKTLCKNLLKEIREMEDNLMSDEEVFEMVKQVSQPAAEVGKRAMELNGKVIYAMKFTFWYYTGFNASHVLDEDKVVDIFNVAQ
jgi:hypothetical protein